MNDKCGFHNKMRGFFCEGSGDAKEDLHFFDDSVIAPDSVIENGSCFSPRQQIRFRLQARPPPR